MSAGCAAGFSGTVRLSNISAIDIPLWHICACHFAPNVFQVQSVVWFFRKHRSRSEETRALTDHHGNKLLDTSQVPYSSDLQSRFSIRLFSLLIFRVGPLDSGLYICGSAHRDFFFGYDLDIQEAHTLSFFPRLGVTQFVKTHSYVVISTKPDVQVRVLENTALNK